MIQDRFFASVHRPCEQRVTLLIARNKVELGQCILSNSKPMLNFKVKVKLEGN